METANRVEELLSGWDEVDVEPKVKRASVLDEAKTIIYGDREKTYGHPSKNLDCIAGMWSAYLTNRLGSPVAINAEDVAVMMTLLKCARLANTQGHRDSLVDGAAYLALVERVQE